MEQDDLLALYASSAANHRDAAYNNLSREVLADMTMSGICPVCHGPLTARYHPARGPYFHCLCAEQALPPCNKRISPAAGRKRIMAPVRKEPNGEKAQAAALVIYR
jgi:hypothetical protein